MNFPDHAKRVFKGEIFDIYQWQQALYDGSTATFEGIKRPNTVLVIATADQHVFMAYEEQPTYPRKYSFLGGRIEPDEEPLAAAKRELKEESGLESGDWELFKQYAVGGKIDWNIYVYIAKNCKKVTEPQLDPGEKIDVKSLSFEEFIDIVSQETFGDIQFANDVLRMRLDPMKLEEFKQKIFKNTKIF